MSHKSLNQHQFNTNIAYNQSQLFISKHKYSKNLKHLSHNKCNWVGCYIQEFMNDKNGKFILYYDFVKTSKINTHMP